MQRPETAETRGCRLHPFKLPGPDDGSRLMFYFNGLHSAILEDYSNSAKIVAAGRFAAAKGYAFLPVSIDYREAKRVMDKVLSAIPSGVEEVLFCGSSMGGWFARILQLRLAQVRPELKSATIAWNPAYDLSAHGVLLEGPQQNFVTLEHYEWTPGHSRALQDLEASVDMGNPAPWFVYVDREDEVIPFKGTRDWHAGRARFTGFPGGCHSFDHYDEALAHFAAIWLGAPDAR